ncbi:MAG: SAM-dependent methyltransferase [Candidatus Thermofonsia Clade 1 bacterium]|uniref:SAM-dependent methyltransferase n=1 Tax=Candidatus Thermofonsia Clade 1 bacterium TaxID=2364210 RepID=A0A2M8P139_9CHLR|nr:MAG: SAM-dependent methyltransferase [Candidatus Thermofonsia Clade 1 bacterium]
MSHAKAHRETLRQKGQFWTPDWLADAMVAYVLERDGQTLFDLAVGAGAFFRAAKRLAAMRNWHVHLAGREVDPAALAQAVQTGLTDSDLADITLSSFLSDPPLQPFEAIVANPPYIRHHRLSAELKAQLRYLALNQLGFTLDGRFGLHNYFLLVALHLLAPEGKLAFVMPADTCGGLSGQRFWSWVTARYALEAVIVFHHTVSPFPKVDINPVVFLIRNRPPQKEFLWARCTSEPEALFQWIASRFEEHPSGLRIYRRDLKESVAIGLSRCAARPDPNETIPFKALFTVMRGIATGANDFFFLTDDQIARFDLPVSFFQPAIGRTRDIPNNILDDQAIETLRRRKCPTWLLNLDGSPIESLPKPLQQYLKLGESLNIHTRPLVAQRSPWYKMETRQPPPFLFAYLGRRNTRFIRNLTPVVPLSSFLCVYPQPSVPQEKIEQLWLLLQQPQLLESLSLVGKSYGGGALKVEPRALERLPMPRNLIQNFDLRGAVEQMSLF